MLAELPIKNNAKYDLLIEKANYVWDKSKKLENSICVASQTGLLFETQPTNLVNEYLLNNEESSVFIEIEPNFNKLEIFINSLWLVFFTILSGIIAAIVSPLSIATLLKFYYRKFTEKYRR